MEAPTVEEGQRRAQLAADAFAKRVGEAKEAIAKLAADLIQPHETILTHCHSTAALAALVEAQNRGKAPRVFSTETRPFRQGLITSRALKDAGVDVHLIVDSAALHVMDTQKVTKVIIGADAVDAKGGLYNKIGTRAITLAAKSLGIPVYVCAETFKFSPYTLDGESIEIEERDPAEIVSEKELPGVKIHNPVFDRTPPEQITAYLTDRGMVLPDAVGPLIQREFGGATRWI
jgi:ribose 1,5-bisphosphate isomerase